MTEAEKRKYADYEVIVLPSKGPDLQVVPLLEGGYGILRYKVNRIPRERLFQVYIRGGQTADAVARIEAFAKTLPAGGWAKLHPGSWERFMADGRWMFIASVARQVDDPFVALELEMSVDSPSSIEATA